MYYILDDNGNAVATNLRTWAQWMERTHLRLVKYDIVDDVEISTVFIGLDTGYGPDPKPWETMVFGGGIDGYREGYSSREQALAGHVHALELVRKDVKENR